MKRSRNPTNSSEIQRDNEYYQRKYARLRKIVVQMVHENAAICQEISRIDQKTAAAKSERKFLLKKLLQYEKPVPGYPSLSSANNNDVPQSSGTKPKKKARNRKNPNQSTSQHKSKASETSVKERTHSERKIRYVQPIAVDNAGRPIFPIEIDSLSVYSIGDIVHDRLQFHNKDYIFPVGFCSTHSYTSIRDPKTQCLYTCKILDVGLSPRFEISPEDDSTSIFASQSIENAYASFMETLSLIHTDGGLDRTDLTAYDFFGLSHPVVQNLIQSLPGSRKCIKYEWKKFEVVRHKQFNPKAMKMSLENGFQMDQLEKDSGRQTDINIEALEKWARDRS